MTVIDQNAEFEPGRYEHLERPFSVGLSIGLHLLAFLWLIWHWDHKPQALVPRPGEFIVEFVELASEPQRSSPPSATLKAMPQAATEPQWQPTAKPTGDSVAFKKHVATPPRAQHRANTPVALRTQNGSDTSSHRLSEAATAPSPSGLVASRPEGLPDQDAKALDHPKPPYPAMARRLHQEGEVIIAVHVSAEGFVLSAAVDHTSGYTILDDAAVSSLRDWHFAAAIERGKPVPAFVRVPINYHLSE